MAKGFYFIERQSATSLTLYKDNTSAATSAVNTVPSYGAFNLHCFARNLGGAAVNFANKRLSFFSIGLPMTAEERAAFHAAVMALQTDLGRNV